MTREPLHLVAAKFERVEDDWCEACQTSSIFKAALHTINKHGVTLQGYVQGCSDCKDWRCTNLKGQEINVIRYRTQDLGN